MNLEKHLRAIEKDLPLIESPDLAASVHWTPSENFPVHRWFRYREGFSPYLLEHFSDSRHRLDPFCGCGTTLLESARQGIHSYGIDLNPLATFVARTKVVKYSGNDKNLYMRFSKQALSTYKNLDKAPLPEYPLLNKLFLPESLDVLLRLWTFIDSVEPKKIRDLLFLTWLSILEKSSNVFKEGNGLKYRNKRRMPGRYETIPDAKWIPRYFGKSIRSFIEGLWLSKSDEISEDIEGFRFLPGFNPIIRTGSCLDRRILDFNKPIDLTIFSPPYANRFDYFEAFKMELWMGGFVKTSADMARLRSASMRNNLAAKRFESEGAWPPLYPFLEAMDPEASSVGMGIKNALQGYFYDTKTLLKNLKEILIKRAKVVIVIGNSAYAKSIIPTDVLVARIGLEEGYKVKEIRIARHLHVSSQQRGSLKHLSSYMRESVIVMEN